MVARILRLGLTLSVNSLLRPRPGRLLYILCALTGGFLSLAALWSALAADSNEPTALPQAPIVAISVLGLGIALVPWFMSPGQLDPRQFRLSAATLGQVALGVPLAALCSIPGLLLIVLVAAASLQWLDQPAGLAVGALQGGFMLPTLLLTGLLTRTVAAWKLRGRRTRETLNGLGALLLLIGFATAAWLASRDWGDADSTLWQRITELAAANPLAAPVLAAAALLDGNLAAAQRHATVAVATLLILALLWVWVVWRMNRTLDRPARRTTTRAGLGWFDRMPATPTGVIGARSLTYWVRDPRYRVPLAIVPLVPFAMLLPLVVVGVPLHIVALFPLPVLCFFLAWSIHNDVSLDNTAVWVHIASATSGFADRFGRLIPIAMIGLPLLIVGSAVTVLVYGDVSILGSVLGVNLGILLTGAGVSSATSVIMPYPSTRPGDSPFVQPQATGSSGVAAQIGSILLTLLAVAPTVVLAVRAFQGELAHSQVGIFGVGLGIAVLTCGVLIGALLFRLRASALLAFAQEMG